MVSDNILETKYIFVKQITLNDQLFQIERTKIISSKLFLKGIIYIPSLSLVNCASSNISLINLFLANTSSPLLNFADCLFFKIDSSKVMDSTLIRPLINYEYNFPIELFVHNSTFQNITNLDGHGTVNFLINMYG